MSKAVDVEVREVASVDLSATIRSMKCFRVHCAGSSATSVQFRYMISMFALRDELSWGNDVTTGKLD